jgi:hypothetical protein
MEQRTFRAALSKCRFERRQIRQQIRVLWIAAVFLQKLLELRVTVWLCLFHNFFESQNLDVRLANLALQRRQLGNQQFNRIVLHQSPCTMEHPREVALR